MWLNIDVDINSNNFLNYCYAWLASENLTFQSVAKLIKCHNILSHVFFYKKGLYELFKRNNNLSPYDLY